MYGQSKNMSKLKPEIENQIDKFVKYIRRMNSITDDDQLELLLQISYNQNQDSYTSLGVDLDGHVRFIREMSRYSDDKLRNILRTQYGWDLTLQDIFESNSKRVAIREMTEAAKDYKSDPRRFSRKVDAEFRR